MKTAATFLRQLRPGPLRAALAAGCLLAAAGGAAGANPPAGALAPLPLTLPAPTLKGTPPDAIPTGPNLEPLDLAFETKEGRLIDAKGTTARCVRCTTQGGSESGVNRYTEIEVYGLPAR